MAELQVGMPSCKVDSVTGRCVDRTVDGAECRQWQIDYDMIEASNIQEIVEKRLEGTDIFVVGIVCSPGGDIEITVDSDTNVDIDSCVLLSRYVEEQLDRDVEDFALTVCSAGIGQPLKVLRQYRKLIDRPVEVVLFNGEKFVARLSKVDDEAITIVYTQRQAVEGKKRKVETEVEKRIAFDQIKTTKEFLDFK